MPISRFLSFKAALIAVLVSFGQFAWALQIFKIGNLTDVSTPTESATCLAGGGYDDGWAEGWNYLLRQSGGGDIVIVRADHEHGDYESWIYNDDEHHGFPRVNSVTTLSIDGPSDVNQPEVINALLKAELIFFAGGDQNNYVQWFKNSKLSRAINYMIYVKKTPVGGTSAGMALLAGIDYTGKYPSPTDHQSNVSSGDVLRDPTADFVDLDQSVLTAPFLKTVITDTHFSQRYRQGRLVGFMARAIYNNYKDITFQNIKGIAADEETAICYDHSGAVKVFGQGNAFFLRGLTKPERLQIGSSLDWSANGQAISSYVISARNREAKFNLKSWSGTGGRNEFWSVDGQDENAPILIKK